MAAEIIMPQVCDSAEAVKILNWKQTEGNSVKPGDVLAEVETDKANVEIEAAHEGTLVRIVVPAGGLARPGDVLGYVGERDENPASTGQRRQAVQPSSKPAGADGRARVSPLARRLAHEHGVDLSTLAGSGPEGRIVKKDIEAALEVPAEQPRTAPAEQVPQAKKPVESQGGTLTPFPKMRAAIAKRMRQSVLEAPHFFMTISIAMDASQELRDALRKKPEFKGISVNHLIIKAAAYALTKEARVNRAVRDDKIFAPDRINIGMVTAVEDGLIIPVIKDTDKLSLKDVVAQAREVIERVKANRLSAGDLTDGTFTISNMGMYDVENFTAIINPGQGAILAVSSIQDQPVVRNGAVTVGKMMKVTLSVDHRVIDGVMAGIFLKYFKEALEAPALLLL